VKRAIRCNASTLQRFNENMNAWTKVLMAASLITLDAWLWSQNRKS